MKRTINFNVGAITGKLNINLRLALDDQSERFSSGVRISTNQTGDEYINVNLYPMLSLIIHRENIVVEGVSQRAPFNRDDMITLSRSTIPIFIHNFDRLLKEFETPELYKYIEDRLELNDKLAEAYRKRFMVGPSIVELVPVIIDDGDSKMEGIRMKFNVEDSTVVLTMNEAIRLSYTIKNLNIDALALQIYLEFGK
jgi:hypothetical protein